MTTILDAAAPYILNMPFITFIALLNIPVWTIVLCSLVRMFRRA